MLDRYSGWLNYRNATGDVMAETRGRREDQQLAQAYLRTYESGTLLFPASHHQRALSSKEIKIKPKCANIAGLQLADILAHPVKQTILIEQGRVPDPGVFFGRRLYEAVRNRFNCNWQTGRVTGYGIVYLPRSPGRR